MSHERNIHVVFTCALHDNIVIQQSRTPRTLDILPYYEYVNELVQQITRGIIDSEPKSPKPKTYP